MDWPGQVIRESLLLLLLLLLARLEKEAINAAPASRSSSPSSSAQPSFVLASPPPNETLLIYFNPPAINMKVHSRRSIYFNYSLPAQQPQPPPPTREVGTEPPFSSSSSLTPSSWSSSSASLSSSSSTWSENDTYLFVVLSPDIRIVLPLSWEDAGRTEGLGYYPLPEGASPMLVMPIELGRQYNFTLQAMHVGRVTLSLALLTMDQEEKLNNLPEAGYLEAISVSDYSVTNIRGERTADLVFDGSAAAVAILISFGIGCVTDIPSLKQQLKYPVSLVIGFCCQFILMPVLAFGLAMLLPLGKEERFGLLCVACVPGGGIGHVASVIGEADVPLSLTMNMISVVAMLGTAPLWIFVLGQYFHRESDMEERGERIIPIYNFEIWLAATFFAYTAGLLINRFRPNVAEALLMWIIKPMLLLATILYITLGVYINMYVFELIDNFAVLGAVLLPVCGCAIGFVMSVVCRQKASFVKTIALETSSLNCLIVLAALRFSLPHHVSDMASTVPIWVMFSIPGLYGVLAILQMIKRFVENFLESRKFKEARSFSIASGIVTQPGMAALSAPLFVSEAEDNDHHTANEKVTVL